MRWSQQLGRVAGIGIFVHWTFLLLIGWVVLVHFLEGDSAQTAVIGVLFVLAVFACVLLHELGHALAAKRFGIATHDITLLPIGGVARLERMPEQPSQELAVALAGPAVNFVIAGSLLMAVTFFEGLRVVGHPRGGREFSGKTHVGQRLSRLFQPSARLSDGRRACVAVLLAKRMEYVRATQVAATVGQGMAIMFAILGFFSNWFLLFIALFVYLGAQGEAHQVQVRSVLRGVPVDAAMTTKFRCLEEEEQVLMAVEELLAGHQHDFPIMREGRLSGVLTRENLIRAVAAGRRLTAAVSEFTVRDCPVVEHGAMLEDVFAKMQEGHTSTVPVLLNGELVGLLTLENIGEWMMIQSAFRQSRPFEVAV